MYKPVLTAHPRRDVVAIDREAVADAVAELFAKAGCDAISMTSTARALSMSRAALSRIVASEQELDGILYQRVIRELVTRVKTLMCMVANPRRQLVEMIKLHAQVLVRLGPDHTLFFGGADLPRGVVADLRIWNRRYEKLWRGVVVANMDAGHLEHNNPIVVTRLILGMTVWVSLCRRDLSAGGITADQITTHATRLLGLSDETDMRRCGFVSRPYNSR